MADFIVCCILVICVGLACYSIYRNKKKGAKCAGCQYAGNCSGGCGKGQTSK